MIEATITKSATSFTIGSSAGRASVAKIQIGQEMFEVRSGQRLSERKPVSQ